MLLDGKLCANRGTYNNDKCNCLNNFEGENCANCQGDVIIRDGKEKCVASTCVTESEECYSNGFCENGICICNNFVNGNLIGNNYDSAV